MAATRHIANKLFKFDPLEAVKTFKREIVQFRVMNPGQSKILAIHLRIFTYIYMFLQRQIKDGFFFFFKFAQILHFSVPVSQRRTNNDSFSKNFLNQIKVSKKSKLQVKDM